MSHNINFRMLRADEIEVRPSHIKDGVANLLLYIASSTVVSLLNESVGNLNWQSEFYEVNGQTIGKIGIYDDSKGVWVWKSDTGSESNIESSKGLISDIYKRVLSRWGVQELYSAPRISIPDDGHGCSGYKVSEILYNEHRDITHLVIVNRFGKEVFRWDKDNHTKVQKPEQSNVRVQSKPESSNQNTQPAMRFADDNIKRIVQSISDKANQEASKEGANINELQRFVNFYVNKIYKEGWNGTFNFDVLFSRWMEKSRCKAS